MADKSGLREESQKEMIGAEETSSSNANETMHEEIADDVGKLLHFFKTATDLSIDRILKSDSKAFAKCYHSVWKNNKTELDTLVQRVSDRAREKVQEEMRIAIQNEDIPHLLSAMGKLLSESKTKKEYADDKEKVAWRPSGNPEADSRAYFMALKKRKLQELEDDLQRTLSEEKYLRENAMQKKEGLFSTEAEIKLACDETHRFNNQILEFVNTCDNLPVDINFLQPCCKSVKPNK